MKSPEEVLKFFWSKIFFIEETPGRICWLWTGAKTRGGVMGAWIHRNQYASMRDESGKTCRVHRWAFKKFRGPLPDDKDLDHKICDTSLCVNPWHCEPETKSRNTRRRNFKQHPQGFSGKRWTEEEQQELKGSKENKDSTQ